MQIKSDIVNKRWLMIFIKSSMEYGGKIWRVKGNVCLLSCTEMKMMSWILAASQDYQVGFRF